jgi:hypothetical protein
VPATESKATNVTTLINAAASNWRSFFTEVFRCFQEMNTAPTENAASNAHNVSAGWGFSVTSKPPIKEIPTVRVITQPATAAALTTQPLSTTQSC